MKVDSRKVRKREGSKGHDDAQIGGEFKLYLSFCILVTYRTSVQPMASSRLIEDVCCTPRASKSSIIYAGIANTAGATYTNFMLLNIPNNLTRECTVRPFFKSPRSVTTIG